MPRRPTTKSGRSVLIVDDNAEYLSSCARLVGRDGHDVLTAHNAREGLAILRSRAVDLVLVDYFMPGMTSEELVAELRRFNPLVQVVLQTGYANDRPPREMLQRLDIQGYHDKSEGPEKLRMWIDIGLKAAFTTQLLNKSRIGLAYILSVTPELHRIQPLEDLLQGVLVQTVGLLGAVDSFLAVAPAAREADAEHGFVAVTHRGGELRICAATGRFAGHESLQGAVGDERARRLASALERSLPETHDGATVVPLRVGDTNLGMIYVDRTFSSEREVELLMLFANQAAVAIQNVSLYELAAVDPLTRVYTRRFYEHAFIRELRTAQRAGAPIGFVLVDVDDMKTLNDSGGHLAGDRALEALGALLKGATRASDIVGRFGGDEFAVLLPRTDAAGARAVVDRIVDATRTLSVEAADGTPLPVRVSVGAVVLDAAATFDRRAPPTPHRFFKSLARAMIARADEALYTVKGDGKGRAAPIQSMAWTREEDAPMDAESGSHRLAAAFGMPLLDAR